MIEIWAGNICKNTVSTKKSMKHGINRLKHPVMQRQEYTNWLMNRTENITLRHITMTLQLLHQYYINICHNWDILQLLVSVLLSDPPVYTAVAVSLSSGVTLSHKALSTLSQKSETVAENGDCRRIRRQSHFSATVWIGFNRLHWTVKVVFDFD